MRELTDQDGRNQDYPDRISEDDVEIVLLDTDCRHRTGPVALTAINTFVCNNAGHTLPDAYGPGRTNSHAVSTPGTKVLVDFQRVMKFSILVFI